MLSHAENLKLAVEPREHIVRQNANKIQTYLIHLNNSCQWRNDAPGAPATPGGAVIEGRQNVIKMWDNFARLTARLAKVRVWFNNSTIYLDFWAVFSHIDPSKPCGRGRH